MIKEKAATASIKMTKSLPKGVANERGMMEYNMARGERRAREAMKYLVKLGIDNKKIKTISYGKTLDPGHNKEAWSMNRRDRFVNAHQQ